MSNQIPKIPAPDQMYLLAKARAKKILDGEEMLGEKQNKKRVFSKKMSFVKAIRLAQDKINLNMRRHPCVVYEFIAIKKVIEPEIEYEYNYRDSILFWDDKVKDGESCAGSDFVVSWSEITEP